MNKYIALLAATITIFVTGCASPPVTPTKPNAYNENSIGRKMYTNIVRVESVRRVEVRGNSSSMGGGFGLVLGAAAGHTWFGKGSGRTAGAILGAMLGYLATTTIEKGINSRDGIAISVVEDRTRMRYIVVQDDDGTIFMPGDLVELVNIDGKYRVVK